MKGLMQKAAPPKYLSGAEKYLPPEMQGAFEKAVLAGQKFMYSEPMADMINQMLSGEGQVEKKVAEGVVGLMGVIMSRSKPQMPPQIIIPVAVELLYEGLDMLTEAGRMEELSPEQMRLAVQATVALMATKLGAKPDQVRSLLMGQVNQQPEPGMMGRMQQSGGMQ